MPRLIFAIRSLAKKLLLSILFDVFITKPILSFGEKIVRVVSKERRDNKKILSHYKVKIHLKIRQGKSGGNPVKDI